MHTCEILVEPPPHPKKENLEDLDVHERFFRIWVLEKYCVRMLFMYRVILSVLDPRKCEYLKDYSLDFEHAYMTTCFMRSMSILEEMLEMFATTV